MLSSNVTSRKKLSKKFSMRPGEDVAEITRLTSIGPHKTEPIQQASKTTGRARKTTRRSQVRGKPTAEKISADSPTEAKELSGPIADFTFADEDISEEMILDDEIDYKRCRRQKFENIAIPTFAEKDRLVENYFDIIEGLYGIGYLILFQLFKITDDGITQSQFILDQIKQKISSIIDTIYRHFYRRIMVLPPTNKLRKNIKKLSKKDPKTVQTYIKIILQLSVIITFHEIYNIAKTVPFNQKINKHVAHGINTFLRTYGKLNIHDFFINIEQKKWIQMSKTIFTNTNLHVLNLFSTAIVSDYGFFSRVPEDNVHNEKYDAFIEGLKAVPDVTFQAYAYFFYYLFNPENETGVDKVFSLKTHYFKNLLDNISFFGGTAITISVFAFNLAKFIYNYTDYDLCRPR